MYYNMKIIFVLLLMSISCLSQETILQPIGSSSTLMISCPCKLFKYYEKNQLFYECKDALSNTKFVIKETQHKDVIDKIINVIDQNLYKEGKQKIDSITNHDKQQELEKFLNTYPSGYRSKILGNDAIIVDLGLTRKAFFSDEDFIVSYEISISGKTKNIVDSVFNNSIKSLILKRENLKKLL